MKKIISRRRRKVFLKRIKFIMIFLVIIIGIFSFKMVKAGINDSLIKKNRIDGVYAVTRLDGKDRIFYLNMYTLNERVAYCIEIGVDIDTDIYNSTYDFSVSGLSNEQIEYIRNISYFGYGYLGHDDYRYYMAAQELIWEYLNEIEVDWTEELNIYGDIIDITNYKNEILKLVKDYNRGFDFRGYVKDKVVNIGDRIDINDVNNNLKYYDVVSGEHMSAMIYDKLIFIDFDTDYVGKDSLILKRKEVYDYDGLLYYQGGSQKLISNGNIDEEVELQFDIRGRNISFLLKDNSGLINSNQYNYDGISYELFNKDNKFVSVLQDNGNGKYFIGNVPYGDYCVKQVKTNNSYKLNENNFCFTFDENSGVVFLEVEPLLNKLQIFKLYGDSNNLQIEKQALFEVYSLDGSLYGMIETNNEGIGSLEIPYGEYIIKQVKGKNGYYLVDDFKVNAKVKGEVIEYTLVDEEIMVNLLINSINNEQDLVFDSDIYYKIKKKDTLEYLKINDNFEFRNTDGQVLIPNKLSYGDYILEIVNKSNKYNELVEKVEFEVNDNSDFIFRDGQLYLEVDINYELIYGSVKINTYEEKIISNDGSFYYDNVKSGGVKLGIIADEDIVVNGKVIYNKGDKVLDIVTNEDGEYVIDKINIGSYCIISEFEENICINIMDSNLVEIDIKDDLKKGSVNIRNLSSNLNPIVNSTIELYDSDNSLIFTGITNDDGLIIIEDLVYGDYSIKQKSVSDKYILNEENICFVVGGSELVELEIVNKEAGKKFIHIPNTLNNDDNINRLVVFILFIIGVIIYKTKIVDNK